MRLSGRRPTPGRVVANGRLSAGTMRGLVAGAEEVKAEAFGKGGGNTPAARAGTKDSRDAHNASLPPPQEMAREKGRQGTAAAGP